ncbi:MAG: catalase-related domain-containing protein, partial [Rhodococcus sp. (in: high G+C Gram-positive bacteria)]
EHVAYAYTFELGKCYEQTIKERQLQILANIDADLCATVAAGLGLEAPAPTIELVDPAPSPALSQVGKTWPVQGRIIGVVADDTSDLDQVQAAVKAIDGADCVPLVIAPHGGKLGGVVPISRTFLTARSVEFDAVLFATPAPDPRARLLVDETLRHQKAVAAWGDGRALFEGVAAPGVVSATGPEDAVSAVLELLGTHRVWERTAM